MASEPLNRLVRATVVSLIGRREVYRWEAAFRQELLVLLLVIRTAWLLTSVSVERALLIGSWMLIIVVEMVNSAMEAAVDRAMSFRGKQKISVRQRSSARLCFRRLFGYWFLFPARRSPKG